MEIKKIMKNSHETNNHFYVLTSDCFTDCWVPGKFYPGIRSSTKDGQNCEAWSNPNGMTIKSNICYGDTLGPSCSTRFGMESCNVPMCSTIVDGNKRLNNVAIIINILRSLCILHFFRYGMCKISCNTRIHRFYKNQLVPTRFIRFSHWLPDIIA